ncbi:TKL/DICTY4 protein kinase [Salpingoeca rosetta]|uniref:guanylate cyclase n=1 Tax=Salpingoeca rosetta (strain ATCC 50818 / BSB-021) TaxID=946362 RepID=F2UI68_SALR5|nr:TKL/DICTY4 protein kinase [Salpingoeca rosetta]EGD76817.1 TKL/DICTY4 protein kinase [Salpingoeca rosetta]|eukprot:XP_004991189.1 TKL/DICTY4 protein kinase [Salpingoeca rosetta]
MRRAQPTNTAAATLMLSLLTFIAMFSTTSCATPATTYRVGCTVTPINPWLCNALEDIFERYAPWDVTFQYMTEVDILDNAASLDFALVDPKTVSCLDVEHAVAPLATLGLPNIFVETRKDHNDYLYQTGGVIFALASSELRVLTDVKDKIVAATTTTDFASTLAPFAEYKTETGNELVMDAAMVQYLGSPQRVLEAVLAGVAHVGMVQTGFLERAVARGDLAWAQVSVLSQNLVVEDDLRFPYVSSTLVYPDWSLIAFDSADADDRETMMNFVFSTNTTLDIHFTTSRSYATVGDILETYGVIVRDLDQPLLAQCPRSASHFVHHGDSTVSATPDHVRLSVNRTGLTDEEIEKQLETIINCPSDTYPLHYLIIFELCDGMDCPEHSLCICRPCQHATPVQIHHTEEFFTQHTLETNHALLADILGVSCGRMRTCSQDQQPNTQYFLVEDHLYDVRDNQDTVFFHVNVKSLEGDGFSFSTEGVPVPGHPYLATVNISGLHFGTLTVEVFLADRLTSEEEWEPITASPFLVDVLPRDCPKGEVPTQDNMCVCPAGALRIGGKCMDPAESTPLFVALTVFVIGVIGYIVFIVMRKRADALWQIDSEDIVVSDPPEVLGMGAFGVVIKGELNGTGIAIKRVMPKPPSRSKADKATTSQTRSTKSSPRSVSRAGDRFMLSTTNFEQRAASRGDTLVSAMSTHNSTMNTATKSKRGRSLQAARAEFLAEMRLLSRLRHPCVATMLGATLTKSGEVLLVMEYLEHGSLYDFLRNDKLPTPDMFLLPIVKDIVSGMRYIHNLKPPVVHGDLKAKNVLVDGNFKAKIADFGLSQKRRFGCGTPYWMAPEVLRGGEVTREADVYSFAITVYEIYSRQDPFPEENVAEVLQQIAARQVPAKRPDIPDSCPVMLAELARRCWSEEPKFRPTFDQVDAQLGELNISKVGASLIQQKQDALKKATVLNDVFPPHIAKMLEEGKKVHPEHKDDVTIFFSDIVGFTNISAQLTPAAVSDMLDRLYSAFDELTEKHGVFKVETIGDAYMAATNLVEPQHDHALRIAQFAEDAIKAAQSTFIDMERPELGCVNIRVGFHCGPVVANVVGRRNPRYCLFGDTVNTASRMESSSERNKIHVSTSAGDRVRSQAPWVKLESRGVQNIKGKGEMLTYWLVSTKREKKKEGGQRVMIASEEAEVIEMPNEDTSDNENGGAEDEGDASSKASETLHNSTADHAADTTSNVVSASQGASVVPARVSASAQHRSIRLSDSGLPPSHRESSDKGSSSSFDGDSVRLYDAHARDSISVMHGDVSGPGVSSDAKHARISHVSLSDFHIVLRSTAHPCSFVFFTWDYMWFVPCRAVVLRICNALEDIFERYAPWDVTFQYMTEVDILDNAASLDFALVDPKTVSCLDVEHAVAPLATLGLPNIFVETRKDHNDYLYQTGGVIFALASSELRVLTDVKDKIVAATTTTDFASTLAPFAEYKTETGNELVMDAAMVQYLGSPQRVLEAVLAGVAHVGMVQTGFLERAVARGDLAWAQVSVLSQNLVVEDDLRFPYVSSTLVYPDWSLIAFDSADADDRETMMNFVFSTNTTLDIHFTTSRSYATVGDILETYGVIVRDLDQPLLAQCPRSASHFGIMNEATQEWTTELSIDVGSLTHDEAELLLSDLVICPANTYALHYLIIFELCDEFHCPEEAFCTCSPCKRANPVQIHHTEEFFTQHTLETNHALLADILGVSCGRMRTCSQDQQPNTQFLLIEDKVFDERHNQDTVFFHVNVKSLEGDGFSFSTEGVPVPGHPYLATVNISGLHFGTLTVEVFLADRLTSEEEWEPITASPFLVDVLPRDCPKGEVPTQDNMCVCPAGALRIGGKCMDPAESTPLFVCISLVVIGLAMYGVVAVMRKRADALWHIDSEDIVVSDPPDMLGRGAFGVVIKGELNGTGIAIKRAMPRPSSDALASSSKNQKSGTSVASFEVKGNSSQAGVATTVFNLGYHANGGDLIEKALKQDHSSLFGSTQRGRTTKDYSVAKAEFMAEIRLLSRLRHPCVATMLGAIVTRSKEVLLVMEYLEHGSLYDFLRNDKLPTPDMFLLPIVKDIVSGMRYIHNLKPPVVHGDLKAKNVLVDGNFKAKIADFGLSQKRRFGCGTPYWMAPEVLRGGEVTREADVYSFAITVYEIYSRQDPFPEENVAEVLQQIAARQVPAKRPDIPDSCPVMLAELARRCWSEEPKFRPTFDQVDAQLGELNISKVGASLIQQKQDALKKATVLNDVFPPHIAKMLEEGKKVHPEHKDDVTIFFSDIVGFTNISAQLTPAAVSDMLDRLYSAFDELTEKHGVFKVETIGDAYMAATNLVEPQHDHALRIAQFAEDAIKAAQSTFIDMERPELGCVNIRVGFHCGPVVANVVGRRNPRYCLFGDTVNTASRMESSSERNKIHVSTSAGDRVRSQAPWVKLESRGVQNIKGKGEMLTYWLVSTKREKKKEGGQRVMIASEEAEVIEMPNESKHRGDGDKRSAASADKPTLPRPPSQSSSLRIASLVSSRVSPTGSDKPSPSRGSSLKSMSRKLPSSGPSQLSLKDSPWLANPDSSEANVRRPRRNRSSSPPSPSFQRMDRRATATTVHVEDDGHHPQATSFQAWADSSVDI